MSEIQEVGSGDTREKPIRLGGALFTLVEPHRGHEVAYNRWYERDHFYSGCMIGAWTLSGARFVATRELKALRYPADSPITDGDNTRGSYLALYWVLKGKFGEWIQWGTNQVNWLHANDRMFPHRDHVHTLMYRMRTEVAGVDDGVPAELALDHRFPNIVAIIGEPRPGVTLDEIDQWRRARPLGAHVMIEMTPVPLLADAPSDVPRDTNEHRFLQLYFLDAPVLDVWHEHFAGLGADLDAAGLGTVLFASPFLATCPGTDTYTDRLW
jgi:hypothetical protein